jgi:acyl carrier protein
VEPRVRRLVAARLAVDPEELTADTSLTEDLAADSLDLLELACDLEDALGLSITETAMGRLRTYRELVAVVQAGVRERRAKEAWVESQHTPPFIWARIRPPAQSGSLEHTGWLTPYTAETMIDSVLRSGPGTRLDVGVPRDVGEPMMARLRAQFSWLRRRRIAVHIRRDRHLSQPDVVG